MHEFTGAHVCAAAEARLKLTMWYQEFSFLAQLRTSKRLFNGVFHGHIPAMLISNTRFDFPRYMRDARM